ncbi:hypothetical protein B9G69_007440 [Bdellovibrio sp. SKB1291214]|uniref:hypothetical protein n=1 Tax=Bdellovibrio sp. SKB1291214 TaxID=1732569 RepID=UPI000B51CE76|nr:hypothetical protein [Bdellovibrio sp. SKB1291214]UYL10412.1 hypothetical protein B9G69_007440 [Bdellovibrio sp. SKB1291214]
MNNRFFMVTLSILTLSLIMQTQAVKAAGRGNMGVATLSGVIIGGLIGASIAQNFDDNDNRQAQGMWNQALSGQFNNNPYSFQGNQHRGRLIFTGEGYFDGFYCRIYRSEIWDSRSNTPMVTTGYVCRANDGSWFRKEGGEIQNARPNRPDRGRQFDPPSGGGGFSPQQQQGFPQQGRQMGGGPNMGNNRGNYNNNTSSSSTTGITNGDALPITGVN